MLFRSTQETKLVVWASARAQTSHHPSNPQCFFQECGRAGMLGLRLLAENDNGTVTVNFGSAGASPSQGGTLLGPPSTSSVTPNNTRQLTLTARLGGLECGGRHGLKPMLRLRAPARGHHPNNPQLGKTGTPRHDNQSQIPQRRRDAEK